MRLGVYLAFNLNLIFLQPFFTDLILDDRAFKHLLSLFENSFLLHSKGIKNDLILELLKVRFLLLPFLL
jgi:hypothetical protein